MRKWFSFSTGCSGLKFEQKLYRLVNNYKHAVVLTDKYPYYNGHAQQYHEFDFLAGFDALNVFHEDFGAFDKKGLKCGAWLLGSFAYDVADVVQPILSSENPDFTGFKKFSFFQPRYMVKKSGDNWYFGYHSSADTLQSCKTFLNYIKSLDVPSGSIPDTKFKANVSQKEYLEVVQKLKYHIRRGDIYEINYCIDFFCENITLDPGLVFSRLLNIAPMPFSTLLRHDDSFLMGASPERYMRKRGARIISQPMKGTAKRVNDKIIDAETVKFLSESSKERAENIMIADLVRNDLSRIAARGTVKVDDLCSVFPYPGVFQMISTVSAQMHSHSRWLDPIRYSFPMGSMTGAPKISAMQLIERYEKTARGLFSGSVGYISPELDFDFNVIIRSFLYNRASKYLSYSVGSAITEACEAAAEYEECILKANALRGVLRKAESEHDPK